MSKFLSISSEDFVYENGAFSPKYQGTGTAEIVYKDFLRNEKKVTAQLDIKFLPLKSECITTLKGTASFNEADTSFTVKASSQIGWCYDAGADMSDYNYLVLKLKEPITKASCSFRIYAQNDATSTSYYSKAVGKNDTMVVIDLNNMVRNNKKISPTHIGIISLYNTAASTIKIDDIYLTTDDPTGIETIASDKKQSQAVYDLQGRKMSANGLRSGLYLKEGKKVFIK